MSTQAVLFSTPASVAPRSGSLHFYRCSDCLSVVTVDAEIKSFHDGRTMRVGKCGACGGWLEYMGRSQRARLVKTGFECPCDARCTNAPGPHCDCRCGGENHGSQRWVEVTVDAGGIPTVATPPQAVLLAETYRALKASVHAAIDARFGRVIAAKCAGEYLSGSAYAMYLEGTTLWRAAYAAAELRTHGTRNKKLTGILAQVKKVGI